MQLTFLVLNGNNGKMEVENIISFGKITSKNHGNKCNVIKQNAFRLLFKNHH